MVGFRKGHGGGKRGQGGPGFSWEDPALGLGPDCELLLGGVVRVFGVAFGFLGSGKILNIFENIGNMVNIEK